MQHVIVCLCALLFALTSACILLSVQLHRVRTRIAYLYEAIDSANGQRRSSVKYLEDKNTALEAKLTGLFNTLHDSISEITRLLKPRAMPSPYVEDDNHQVRST